jgi:hypothetical protein
MLAAGISGVLASACGYGTTTTAETVETELSPASGYETPVESPSPSGEVEVEADEDLEVEVEGGEVEIERD